MIDNLDELRRAAERMGLANLADEHLYQFAEARVFAERLLCGIPRNLNIHDEPAHIFRTGQED